MSAKPAASMLRVVVLLWLLAAGAWGVEPEPVLTVQEAVRIALEGNRQVRAADLEVTRNEHLLNAAETQRLPQFGLQVSSQETLTEQTFVLRQGSIGDFPATGPIPAEDTIVSLVDGNVVQLQAQVSQPLTGLHKANLAIDAQDAALEVARQERRGRAQSTVAQVKTDYYALLDTQTAMDAALDSVEFLTELERVVGEQLKEKAVLKADLLEVRARRLEAEATALSLRNAVTTRREQFNLLLGRPLDTPFRVENPLEAQTPTRDLTALEARAQEQRPELLVSRLRVRQAVDQRELKAAEWIPDVSLALRYQRIFNSGLLPGEFLTLELQGQWEPWDWGRRDQESLAAQQAVLQAEQSRAETEAQVLAEVRARLRRLEEARAMEMSTRVSVEAAEERLRVASNRYLQKAALTRDVLDAEAQLARARREHLKSILDYRTAEADLERAVGEDLP